MPTLPRGFAENIAARSPGNFCEENQPDAMNELAFQTRLALTTRVDDRVGREGANTEFPDYPLPDRVQDKEGEY